MERKVILISDQHLERYGYKTIICYKISHQPGTPNHSEETYYNLSISRIKDDFDVQFWIPFATMKRPGDPE